jgi:hypothetical protein
MQPIVRQWVNNLLQWNTLVSHGVTDGWLPLPAGSRSLSCDEVIALAARSRPRPSMVRPFLNGAHLWR